MQGTVLLKYKTVIYFQIDLKERRLNWQKGRERHKEEEISTFGIRGKHFARKVQKSGQKKRIQFKWLNHNAVEFKESMLSQKTFYYLSWFQVVCACRPIFGGFLDLTFVHKGHFSQQLIITEAKTLLMNQNKTSRTKIERIR